jgi:hypothetical protein
MAISSMKTGLIKRSLLVGNTAYDPLGTRGIFAGGRDTAGTYLNSIDYIDISTLGNATNFGDASVAFSYDACCSSNVRGVIALGSINSGATATMEYITIATTGNTTNFGNTTQARGGFGGCGNSTRGIFGGGEAAAQYNIIDYITIATTGNATDFGDLTQAKNGVTACSSSTRGIFIGGDT